MLTFKQVSETNRERATLWHPGFPESNEWSIADWSNAMAGECGEACNVVKKIRRNEEGFRGVLDKPVDGLKEMLAEELADTFCYLDLVATKAGIDLEAAIIAKFNKVSELQGFPQRLGD